jgi:hypothetical protein
MRALMKGLLRHALTAAVFTVAAGSVSAAPLVALRADGSFIFFDSAAPGAVQRTIPLTGVPVSDTVLGIDQRPATGELFLVAGACNYIYAVDAPRGLAMFRGDSSCVPIGVPPPPVASGVDFNPTVDRIRFVDVSTANLRYNPNNGVLAAMDTNLSTTGVSAVAYDRNFAGTTATTLFAIDINTNQLVRIGGVDGTPSPNTGIVTAIGPLGVDPTDASFEILGDGSAFAALAVGGTTGLYTINLVTGAATLVGTLGTGTPVVGLAGSPGFTSPIPSVSTWGLALLGLGLAGIALFFLRRRAR